MGLFSVMKKIARAAGGERITLFARRCYIEGATDVPLLSESRVEVRTRRGTIRLSGTGLFLVGFYAGDAVVSGTIRAVERL